MKNLFKKIIPATIFAGMFLAYTSAVANPAAGADGDGVGNGDLTGDGIEVSNLRDDVSIPQLYPSFSVATSDDVFVNAEIFTERTGGMQFVDQDGDGIVDVAQNSITFVALQIGPFVDANRDTIHDGFQTYQFYQDSQMTNFVDVDSDGLCDNYEKDPWVDLSEDDIAVSNVRDDVSIPQLYPSFTVDTSEDVFVNPEIFFERTGGMKFVDLDGDGIIEVAQNSITFAALQIGSFIDTNRDTIHDDFQSYQFYQVFQMTNFVDVDSDGLCDNYEKDPWAE